MDNEKLENAHGQAMAAQIILQSFLIVLNERDPVLVKKTFDIAGEGTTIASLNNTLSVSGPAARALQAIDHMRKTVIGNN